MAPPQSPFPARPSNEDDDRARTAAGSWTHSGSDTAGGSDKGSTTGGFVPAPGAGPHDDPGFVASLRGRTMLGQLRVTMLALNIAPVLILAIVPFIVREGRSKLGEVPPWVYAPLVLGSVVAALVAARSPRPMRPGQDPRRAAGTAVFTLRQAIFLRFGLCEGVIILGLPLSILSRSELPFLIGFVCAYPLLVRFTLPTTGLLERMRRRLEADGAESYLWAVLLSRYSPPRSHLDR